MASYFLTEIAWDDLDRIWQYIAQENPIAANHLDDAMVGAFELLAGHPHAGHIRSDLTPRKVRFSPVGAYLVIYTTETDPMVLPI